MKFRLFGVFCVFFYCVIIRKHLKKLTETILYQPSRDKLYSFSRYHLLLFWTRSAVGLRVLRVYTLYPPQRSKVGSWHIHDKLGTHHCNKTTIHICVIKRLWISYGKEKKTRTRIDWFSYEYGLLETAIRELFCSSISDSYLLFSSARPLPNGKIGIFSPIFGINIRECHKMRGRKPLCF